jgi:hypothetical protein
MLFIEKHSGAGLIEIDPVYVDVAVLRWQSYTGQAAVFDGSSQTFEEIRRQRHVEKAG